MPKDPNRVLAANVKALRTQKKWSQEEFAERCGLHRTYIGAIERGERNVTLKTLQELASGLNVSSAELITERRRDTNSEKAS